MTGPRDWDKEMAEIDKMISADRGSAGAAAPTTPSNLPARSGVPGAQTAAARAAPVSPARASRPRDALGVWLKALLGALGASALIVWPYGTVCGAPLYAFLGGTAAVAGAGIWTMGSAWVHRRALAHIVGVLVLLAGLVLGAREILPRTGYAAEALTWTCS